MIEQDDDEHDCRMHRSVTAHVLLMLNNPESRPLLLQASAIALGKNDYWKYLESGFE